MIRKFVIFAVFILAFPALAAAQLSESEVETRARDVGEALRCVICQNQSIEESDASLAADMRLLVRDRIRAGDSNEEVIAYMQDRYGDYVLLKPPFQANTWLLWGAPAILIVLAGFAFMRLSRKRAENAPEALSEEEQAALDKLNRS